MALLGFACEKDPTLPEEKKSGRDLGWEKVRKKGTH
jgi:hypothetical protein